MSLESKTHKVSLEGRGTITLRPSDYITSGGEGVIYRFGREVIKLYSDPQKMRRDGMEEKIALLAKLKHVSIVAPSGLVCDAKGEPIGYYMPHIIGEPLARVFTNDFRTREGFTGESARVLAMRMRDVVRAAHTFGALLVDANELNWLAALDKKKGPTPYVIDVDSWQVGRFAASVIMPSIRDWHTKGFTQNSDWFAWGIVTFQIFSGIHPYKGVLPGFERSDLEGRMKASKSVFEKDVRLPHAVRDFNTIPAGLLGWYEAVFAQGERCAPPDAFDTRTKQGTIGSVLRVVTQGTKSALVYEKLLGASGKTVVRIFPSGIALSSDGTLTCLRTKREYVLSLQGKIEEVVRVSRGYLCGSMDGGKAAFHFVDEATGNATALQLPINTQKLFRRGERMFAVSDGSITELKLTMFGKPILSSGTQWGVLPNATQFFDGVGVMDALGAAFLVLPFGEKACASLRVPELDRARVIEAKAGVRYVALIIITKKGEYERWSLVFNNEYTSYTLTRVSVDGPELNMATLPKGVVAYIDHDGELMVSAPVNGNTTKVEDSTIATDMVLCNWDDRVLYIKSGELWSIRMRP